MPEVNPEAITNIFIAWLEQIGVRISPKALLVDMTAEGRGRGLVAKKSFTQDELIFTIPRRAILNVKHTTWNRTFAGALKEMPKWLALTTVMMIELLQGSSTWSPYLAMLPSKLDSLVFWSVEELSELQASSVIQKIGKESAEAMYDEHIAGLGIPGATVEIFHRIASIVMAYAFDIPDSGCESSEGSSSSDESMVSDEDHETMLAMIPLADMLNADANANNARLFCDAEDLEMRTTKSIREGDEIFNDYGPLPRSALLRCYGYVADSYAPYDVVELSTSSIVSAIQRGLLSNGELNDVECLQSADLDARMDFARREGFYDDSYDIKHASPEEPCIPTELLALLFILLVDDDTFSALHDSRKSLPSRSKIVTERVGAVMKDLLQLRENGYETTLEEDEILLKAGNLSYRKTMAIQVRHGEKMVLREATKEAASFQSSNHRMRMAITKTC